MIENIQSSELNTGLPLAIENLKSKEPQFAEMISGFGAIISGSMKKPLETPDLSEYLN